MNIMTIMRKESKTILSRKTSIPDFLTQDTFFAIWWKPWKKVKLITIQSIGFIILSDSETFLSNCRFTFVYKVSQFGSRNFTHEIMSIYIKYNRLKWLSLVLQILSQITVWKIWWLHLVYILQFYKMLYML